MAYYWEQIKLIQLDLRIVLHTVDLKVYHKFPYKIDKELPKYKCYKQHDVIIAKIN